MQRGLAALSWFGVVLSGGLHVAFWRGLPLSGASLGALGLAFALAACALLGVILTIQKHAGDQAFGFFQVVPGWARVALGIGFLLVVANFVDWMPIAGPWRASAADPAAFERAFSVVLAWQTMAAAFYHSFRPQETPA